MSARRTFALIRRIVAQFRRDERTLGLLFVVPILVTALLGWVLRSQAVPATHAVIVNLDPPAQPFADALVSAARSNGIDIVGTGGDEATAQTAIRNRSADLAVVIPSGSAATVATGGQPTLRVLTPGLNPSEDGAHLADLQRAVVDAVGSLAPAGSFVRPPRLDHQTVFGSASADQLDSLAPVFIGYFAYFFVFILTGVSFLRERIGGTLERLLATPIRRGEIVLGYSLGFGIFATLQVAVLLTFSLMNVVVPAAGPVPAFTIGLGVPTAGSPFLTFLIALVLALGAVNLGIFLSTFARSEFQILQFIPVVIVPQGLLAGIFWPVDTLPSLLQPIAHALPLTYAVDGLREVMIAGSDLSSSTVRLDLAVLVAIAAVLVVVASLTIRREVA